MQPGWVDGVCIDLTDANPDDLFGVFRSDLGVHLGIFFTAIANEYEMPLRHPLDHVVNHPELALATDDKSFDQFISKPKPL